MLKLPFVQGNLLKKILEALKHLVTDANFIVLHLDFLSSHGLNSMWMTLANMSKTLKCAGNDDIITF